MSAQRKPFMETWAAFVLIWCIGIPLAIWFLVIVLKAR